MKYTADADLTEDELAEMLLEMSDGALGTPQEDDGDGYDDDAALAFAQAALDNTDNNPVLRAKAHLQCGVCHWTRGRYEDALEALETARAIGPDQWSMDDELLLVRCQLILWELWGLAN